ncbi:MAG: TetR/AcrR family transcriptional regulator [Solirubrobacteraceae bacterium]|nr:TetR/AcrR family transcriptional regulator [Solirubrobacteraceae bacterium]
MSPTHPSEPAASSLSDAPANGAPRGRTYGGLTAEERLADRRRRLLDVGLELFAERGFAKTGVRELCRASKIGERAFYDTVGSREALLRDVYLEATDAVIADIATALDGAPTDLVGRLHVGLMAFFRSITDDPRRGRLIYVESIGRGPEFEETRREGMLRFVDFVIERLGDYLADPKPSAAAIEASVSAIILGIGEIAFRLAEGEDRFTAEQAADQITRGLGGTAVALGILPMP